MEQDLKSYREIELRYYVIGNILLMTLLTGLFPTINTPDISSNVKLVNELLTTAIISSIIYVYIFLMDSLVPPKFRQYAVFFPNGKMPGATVFTKIKNKTVDVRFTPEDAKKRYAKEYAELDIISDTKLQQAKENSLWYRIYIHHENDEKIRRIQHDSLLCRDLFIATIWLGLIVIALYLLGIFPINKKCIIVVGTELVLTNIAARVKAKRFVYTVIAQDVHSKIVEAEKEHIK